MILFFWQSRVYSGVCWFISILEERDYSITFQEEREYSITFTESEA